MSDVKGTAGKIKNKRDIRKQSIHPIRTLLPRCLGTSFIFSFSRVLPAPSDDDLPRKNFFILPLLTMMANRGRPAVIRVHTNNNNSDGGISCCCFKCCTCLNLQFLRTEPGMLKIAEAVSFGSFYLSSYFFSISII